MATVGSHRTFVFATEKKATVSYFVTTDYSSNTMDALVGVDMRRGSVSKIVTSVIISLLWLGSETSLQRVCVTK